MDIATIRRRNLEIILREQFDGNKSKLASLLNIESSYLSRFFAENPKNRRNIGGSLARRIEKAAGKRQNWMDVTHNLMEEVGKYESNVSVKELSAQFVPIVTWDRACARSQEQLENDGDFVMTTKTTGDRSYALEVRDDSMLAAGGDRYSFPQGAMIVVDPDVEPHHQSFVIARLGPGQEPTFKQLVIDAGARYLKPLNTRYPLLALPPEGEICGVVVHMVMDVY